MHRAKTLLVGVAAALACTAPANAAQAPWAAPAASLAAGSNLGELVSAPDVATAPDGTAVAVWTRAGGGSSAVQAAVRPAGGTFGAPVTLSRFGVTATAPAVTMAADGTATVVWSGDPGSGPIVQVTTRPPGGAFGDVLDLAGTGLGGAVASIATAPDGTTVVAWPRDTGGGTAIQAATRPAGGDFGPPADLSSPSSLTTAPRVAAGAGGAFAVVWTRFDGSDTRPEAAVRPAGGVFGPAEFLDAGGASTYSPAVAVGADGTVDAVWTRTAGAHRVVRGARRPAGGAFGSPTDLSDPARTATVPQVVAAANGTALAVWGLLTPTGSIVQTADRAADAWTGPTDLCAQASTDCTVPQLAVGADGTATVVWQHAMGADVAVESATRLPGGAFAGGTRLSPRGITAKEPQVAAGPDGSAVALWRVFDDPNSQIQAAVTGNGPALRTAPAIAGTPAPGATLTCAGDAWTGAAAVTRTWLRDGTAAGTGATYAVTEADRDAAITCRVRASNPFGAFDALSAAVRVPPAPPVVQPSPETAPIPRGLPRITGRAKVGRTLTCRPAAFSEASAVATAWLRAGKPIRGATRTRYKVTRRDKGKLLTCRSTATSPGGTTVVVSLGILARR